MVNVSTEEKRNFGEAIDRTSDRDESSEDHNEPLIIQVQKNKNKSIEWRRAVYTTPPFAKDVVLTELPLEPLFPIQYFECYV